MGCQSWERPAFPIQPCLGRLVSGAREEPARDRLCLAGTGTEGTRWGRGKSPAVKGSFYEGAKGAVKRASEPASASPQLLLCKCLFFPSRWESKGLPLPCRQNGDCMAELCLTHMCAHTHTQTWILGLSDKFPLLLPRSAPSPASPWAQLILAQPLPFQLLYTTVELSPGGCESFLLHTSPVEAHGHLPTSPRGNRSWAC